MNGGISMWPLLKSHILIIWIENEIFEWWFTNYLLHTQDGWCLHWKGELLWHKSHHIYLPFPGGVSSPCPPTWVAHENSCYLFSTTLYSWNESKRQCSQLGSYLLKIDSSEELVSVDFCYNYLWSILSRKIEVDSR